MFETEVDTYLPPFLLYFRCENLVGVNVLLRERTDKANEVNEALREDVIKLTADWTRARDELEHKKTEWHNDREVGIWQ